MTLGIDLSVCSYIRRMGLCHRDHQSFLKSSDQNRVERICNGSGMNWSGNLCTSISRMLVYDVSVDNNCHVRNLVWRRKHVLVACDIVVNQCRPVHYQNHYPNRTRYGTCRPKA